MTTTAVCWRKKEIKPKTRAALFLTTFNEAGILFGHSIYDPFHFMRKLFCYQKNRQKFLTSFIYYCSSVYSCQRVCVVGDAKRRP
ncbi:hypothetical protein HF072_05965 [Bacillus sp. RO3]|nr:hypothetical protein [Bacillus sp. RO3]